MDSSKRFLTCLREEEAHNLTRALKTLEDVLGKKSTLQAVISMTKIGVATVGYLLNDMELKEITRPDLHAHASTSDEEQTTQFRQTAPAFSPISKAVKVNTNVTLPAPCIAAGCLPRKRCKSLRGIREHLMLKHSVPSKQAEAFAQAALLDDKQDNENDSILRQHGRSQSSNSYFGGQEETRIFSGQLMNISESGYRLQSPNHTANGQTALDNLTDSTQPQPTQSLNVTADITLTDLYETQGAHFWDHITPDRPAPNFPTW